MRRDVVVMGASAGGVEALTTVVSGLPDDYDAAVFVVLHLPPTAASVLAAVLQRHTSLRAVSPEDGQPIETGYIYVAPPDHHLVVRDGRIELNRGPKENRHRPSVDALFRSVARTFGPRTVGVILSGTLDDGAMGLRSIAAQGGAAIVQDPGDAAFPGMPESAIEAVPHAAVAPAREIGGILVGLMRESVPEEERITVGDETSFVNSDPNAGGPHTERWGQQPSAFTCPECHGTLFLVQEDDSERFRCRVGHGFSAESLLAGQSDALEAALWAALRALEERNDLVHRMAQRARDLGQRNAAARFDDRARDGDTNIGLIREVLMSGETARDSAS